MWLRIVNQPFPINTWRRYWLRGASFGLFVFLFLFLFKPFYLHLYSTWQLFYTSAIYGLVTGAVIFSGSLLLIKGIAPRIREEKWTLGKQILWNTLLMVCIALLNVFVTQVMHQMILPLWWYFTMLKWVFMLGIFPVAVAELLTYNHFLRRHLKSAAELTQMVESKRPIESVIYKPVNVPVLMLKQELRQAPVSRDDIPGEERFSVSPSVLVLTGENQGDQLELPWESLLAVQALDNYVNVYREEDDRLQTTMLRNTLTNIAEQLKHLPGMYRTHRGWLVNTRKVKYVSGNAQGLKLSIDLMQQEIPVSRSNIAGYRELTEWQNMAINN